MPSTNWNDPLVRASGEDRSERDDAPAEAEKLREAMRRAVALLESDHVLANSFRMGLLGSRDVQSAVNALREALKN